MAKKKTALTIEERLQQALVPANEQPYDVPENWVWCRLGAICCVTKGKTNDFKDDIKYIGLEHLETDNGIVGFDNAENLRSTKSTFKAGNILYGRLRPYLNKHDIANFDGVCSTDILVFESTNAVVNFLVNKFFDLPSFIDNVVANSKGINLPRVSEQVVLQSAFPLPPLAEQQRIVERIEELFAKLDEAKEKLQEVVDGFAVRKAAILHKAFTGELTKKWRAENGVSDDSWGNVPLKKLTSTIGDGLHGTPIYSECGDYYFINGNNFDDYSIVIKNTTKKVSVEEYKKYAVELNDKTVFLSINGTLGKTAFYNGESVILGKSACYINVGEKLDKRFLRALFHTNDFISYANKKATGSTIKNLGLKAIREYMINLPTLPEQYEIVRLLDALLARERKAQQAAKEALANIELMKKAVLARAFRGGLGTNREEEASALALLKEVLE